MFITYMLMSATFQNQYDKTIVHIWFTLTSLGDVVGVLVSGWMINIVGWDWSLVFGIFLFIIFLTAAAIKLWVRDIEM